MKNHQDYVFLMNYSQNLSVFINFLLIRVWQGLAFRTSFFHNYPTSKNGKKLFYKIVCFSSYFDETDGKTNQIINILLIFINNIQGKISRMTTIDYSRQRDFISGDTYSLLVIQVIPENCTSDANLKNT